MRALLIFGLRMGSDNAALIALGSKINALGVNVSFAHWDDKSMPSDYFQIVVGHSYGGDRAAEYVSQCPSQIPLLILIDPVSRYYFPCFIWNFWKKFVISYGVNRALCFTRSWNLLPPSGSIANADGVRYRNYPNINASHDEIPDNSLVSETILSAVKGLL